MTYKYCIIEDNPMAIKSLKHYMKRLSTYHFAGSATDYQNAITLINEKQPDLIFLDIELTNGSGIDIIKSIKLNKSFNPNIIVTTDYEKYAVEAINYDVLYFLTKPFDPDDFQCAIQKFERQFKNQQTHYVYKSSEGYIRIPYDCITVIMSDRNYVNIYRSNGDAILISKGLKDVERLLPDNFIRIHKSFIVQKSYIQLYSLTKRHLLLSCDCNFEGLKHDIIERESQKTQTRKNKLIDEHHQPRELYKIELPIGKSYVDTIKELL